MTRTLPSNLWDDVLAAVRADHPVLVRGWFADLALEDVSHGIVRVRTMNAAQHRYLKQNATAAFTRAAQTVTGRLISVDFLPPCESETAAGRTNGSDRSDLFRADPEQTLEHFLVAPCNRMAWAAATAVTKTPGAQYNPLVLYGPQGTGKTHLLAAASGELLRNNPNRCIVCLPCAVYVERVIEVLEQPISPPLYSRWHDIDALFIDDLGLLAGRERSQEDFFHLFNALLEREKQIVVTLPVPPAEVAGLASRLGSRLSQGLVVPLEPPDFETTVAIVKNWATIRAVDIPDDVAAIVAEHLDGRLENLGAVLMRLDFASHRRSGRINPSLAREVLCTVPCFLQQGKWGSAFRC